MKRDRQSERETETEIETETETEREKNLGIRLGSDRGPRRESDTTPHAFNRGVVDKT